MLDHWSLPCRVPTSFPSGKESNSVDPSADVELYSYSWFPGQREGAMRKNPIYLIVLTASLAGCGTSPETKTEPAPKQLEEQKEPQDDFKGDPALQVLQNRIQRAEMELFKIEKEIAFVRQDLSLKGLKDDEIEKLQGWLAGWKAKRVAAATKLQLAEDDLIAYVTKQHRRASIAPANSKTTSAPQASFQERRLASRVPSAKTPVQNHAVAMGKLKGHKRQAEAYSKAYLRHKKAKGEKHQYTQQALSGFRAELKAFDGLYQKLRSQGVPVKDLPKRPATD